MQNTTRFAPSRALDVICIGRLSLDLYAQQLGSRLEDVTSFAKYLGGSSANIAFGSARLGLKSALLSRVGGEQIGQFLRTTLATEGCDVSHLKTDPDRLSAMVLLGIKDRDTFPLLFCRENCADMALDENDIDEDFIASSKALLITGTHFSTPVVHAASSRALDYAQRHDVRTVLDIDYRPVLWGLTAKGDGEQRFIPSEGVSAHLQAILPRFDLIVGTEEEFLIAGGSHHLMDALRTVRALSSAVLVVKRGPLGCSIIDGVVPVRIDDAFRVAGVQVEVMNVLGAGDAFLAGFLRGWLHGEDYASCSTRANACGALVVSRHGCAPAMPTPQELDYLRDHPEMTHPAQDAMLNRLHRVTVKRPVWDELCVFAFDHRPQFEALADQAGASHARLPILKKLLVHAVAETEQALGLQGRIGVLIDDRYGEEALYAATGRGWWVGRTVELPASNPLQFEGGRSIGSALQNWPQEQVIKCLVAYHPDDAEEHQREQELQIRTLYHAAQHSGHELLLEIIPPKSGAEPSPLHADVVYRSLVRLYDMGIYPEWWKLEQMSAASWERIDALIQERDPYCRGVVLLGLNAPLKNLRSGFESAGRSKTCRGFAVGRTIFQEPSQLWLANRIDDAELIAQTRRNFEAVIEAWQLRCEAQFA